MEKTEELVPKLRFPGFEGEWEVKRLGTVASFLKGKGISKTDIVDDGSLECIRYGELYTTYNELISKVVSKTNLPANGLVLSKYNDVIIPASGETQIDIATASCVLKSGVALSGDLNIIRSPLNGVFLSFCLNNKKKFEIARLAQGSSVMHLYSNQLQSLKINFPTLPEQEKIAGFLSSVDTKLQQLREKKYLLAQYKKGLMQQLFSGALRFKDDQGKDFPDWEEKRLGNVATFTKGKGISKKEITEDGNVECIRYGELYTHYGELITKVISRTNLPAKDLVLSRYNDVIIPSSGETQLDIATASCVLKDGVALGGDLNIIRTEMNGIFLSYYLNNARKHAIAELAQGSSVVHLYSSQLALLEIQIPSLPEQQKIATFLSALDQKIETVATTIAGLTEWKKGLLQGLFV